MQIQQVNHTTIKEHGAYLSTESARTDKTEAVSSLYAYDDEKEIKEALSTQEVATKAKSLTETATGNHAEFVAGIMTPDIVEKAGEQGVDVKDEEEEITLTVVDKIQMEMIESGNQAVMKIADISITEMKALSYSIANAYEMAGKLTPLSSEEIGYLVRNELEPTIGNLYQAKAATGTSIDTAKVGYAYQKEDVSELTSAITEKLNDFAVEESKESIARATQMLELKIPLTEENYRYYEQLENLCLPPTKEQIEDRVYEAIRFGREAASAMMLDGYSWQERSLSAIKVVKEATPEDVDNLIANNLDVTIENLARQKEHGIKAERLHDEQILKSTSAKRVLEQTRLLMTSQANLALLKKGIHLETAKLEEIVEQLEKQESEMKQRMYNRIDSVSANEAEQIEKNVSAALYSLKSAPAYLLYELRSDFTLKQADDYAKEVSEENRLAYEKANGAYERMQTEVRKDLGDSIQKAFRNVDDILEDLDLKVTKNNERAVRILAYNRVELTTENIAVMKEKDEQMQSLFSNMTPRVVLSMIREGYNPLDATLSELNQKAKEISNDLDPQKSERYSKFLYQMEKAGNITQEEKEGYIGIYRLLHQIEKNDGAAIGAAVLAGEKLTMRNLMTQIRNQKAGKLELAADSDSGEVVSARKKDLSITQQIEAAFQTICAENSLKDFTPQQLKQVEKKISTQNRELLDLTPEELLQEQRELLSDTDNQVEETVRQEAQEKQTRQIAEAYTILHNNAQVEEYLTKHEVSKTPENILAVADFLKNRNKIYKDLYETTNRAELMGELVDAKNEIWNRFAESIKTPEEMAKAQEALGELAETTMENMIMDRDATTLDIEAMRMCYRQIGILSKASNKEEYAVPVLIQDEMGTVSLKIVRGKEEKGKVSITLDTKGLGKVAAEFSVENLRLKGYVVAENDDVAEQIKDHKEEMEENMKQYIEETDCVVVSNQTLSLENFHKGASVDGQKNNEVQTKILYGVAKSFIGVLQSM